MNMRIFAVFTLTLPLGAQDALLPSPRFPDAAFFRQSFSRELPRVEINPPVRLSDFAVGDHLELSLRSYIELVLANNTDIQVQRLSIETSRNAITRAYGRFDPSVVTSFSATRANQQSTNILQGANNLRTLNQPFSFAYDQTLPSGTSYQVGFTTSKSATNDQFSTFNPSITSGLRMQFSQPLLRNRGGYANRIPIMVARSRLRQTEYNLNDTLIRLLQQAELAYWNVIDSRESLQVQEKGLSVQAQFLKRSQRELELGAISALDIYQPQQSYATQEVAVTQARYRLQQTEDVLRRQMGADMNPEFRNMPIVLTESAMPPTDERPLDKESYVETAYRYRTDLKAQLQSLDIDDLNYRTAQNRLQPDFSLGGIYLSNGRGGNFIPRTTAIGSTAGASSSIVYGGLTDALGHVFGFDFPTYTFSLTLRLPIRDRVAQADLADATVSKRLDSLRARSLEQTIRLDVLNAITQVENSRASVKLAEVALDFSQKRLDAEQKKYDLGVTTIFFLLDAQNSLTSAQANVVRQSVDYRRNLLSLLRVTGTLLEERGVAVQ